MYVWIYILIEVCILIQLKHTYTLGCIWWTETSSECDVRRAVWKKESSYVHVFSKRRSLARCLIYAYVCTCIYVYIYILIYVCTNTYTYTYIYMYIIRIYVHIYTNYVYIYIHIFTQWHICVSNYSVLYAHKNFCTWYVYTFIISSVLNGNLGMSIWYFDRDVHFAMWQSLNEASQTACCSWGKGCHVTFRTHWNELGK